MGTSLTVLCTVIETICWGVFQYKKPGLILVKPFEVGRLLYVE